MQYGGFSSALLGPVSLGLIISLTCPVDAADSVDETRGRFVRQWWYEPGLEHGNPVANRRFRVNAPEAVLHPEFSKRSETKSSGMLQILMPEDLLQLRGAELYLELWGGHPGTANRRVTLNGRSTYPLPNPVGEHCTHAYPVVPLKRTDLVEGHNAVQFACDQGTTFWGHFIVEQACLRAELPAMHSDLKQAGLDAFIAAVQAIPSGPNSEALKLSLALPADFAARVSAVDFEGRYDGYDENGNGQRLDWHGFTKGRRPVAHLGTVEKSPFETTWDLKLLADQKDMEVRAVVHFRDLAEVIYITPPLTGLATPGRTGVAVCWFAAKDLPAPFWSRAKRLKTCTIDCDLDPTRVEQAELHIVVWDGGAGTVEKYFTLNGRPLPVAGSGKHDVIYSRIAFDPTWLHRGANRIELLSDTEHHGIEVLLPGPAIAVRIRK
jgi:hypothetical protein